VRKWPLEFRSNKNEAQKQDNLVSDLRIQLSNIKPNINRICEVEEEGRGRGEKKNHSSH
jgi:hypothetical protein